MQRLLLITLTILTLTACSTLPEELNTRTADAPITDYQQWKNTPLVSKKEVRLGGVITKITNQKDKTRIEIANIPISSIGKPELIKRLKVDLLHMLMVFSILLIMKKAA